MTRKRAHGIERRDFLKQTGLAAGGLLGAPVARAARLGGPRAVSIVLDTTHAVGPTSPARWAAEHLEQSLRARGIESRLVPHVGDAPARDLVVLAADPLPAAGEPAPAPADESFTIAQDEVAGRDAVIVRAPDPRGHVYALTELADRVALSDDPATALASVETRGRPANAIRSCMRLFCSDVEDKAWFRDREFWTSYLSMLVAQRFNRFNLSFGLGYDFTTGIRDAYLHFTYPFLLAVPGYDVRATNLPDRERDANLEMLRFISDQAARRGLQFQLGLWTHAYEWTDSPDANHRIEGLTPESLGPYCRDALTLLLEECPNIAGLTIRTHGESGIGEGSYDLWRMVFEGARRSGRPVELDLHAKGIDRTMIDVALQTGLPVVISPKLWAEHLGLPYHQAWIRPTELPKRERGEGLFARSAGARSFMRYGYGDLLDEQRRYGILHRIWPGTQRVLLWGDPELAAAYSRSAGFCGTQGAELMEPLSFKGRKGSGREGRRTGYAEAGLVTRHDYEKYLYTYRLWGRLLYDPDAYAESWQRLLRRQYGEAAAPVEASLAASSRILPLVTTAHTPSAANNHWWPEMAVHMSIIDASHPEPFTDTPVPKRFGAVSPLDPQLFASVDDFARELSEGAPSGRYTPAEVAARLDRLADDAASGLGEARSLAADPGSPELRRVFVDATAQIELGRFFAEKLRAACLYALFERTRDQHLLASAVARYSRAREVWTRIADITRGVYVDDVTYGPEWYQRGHWADRLDALERDRAAMASLRTPGPLAGADAERSRAWERAVLAPAERPRPAVRHAVPEAFERARPLAIELEVSGAEAVRLRYRHTNQAEPWPTETMVREGGVWRATIPSGYTDSVFPLQYYFELVLATPAAVVLCPGFDASWANTPYCVVRQRPPSVRSDGPADNGQSDNGRPGVRDLALTLSAQKGPSP
ncbi:MAG: twin-arginine translocation signal domain-containing protein [Acidobacteriota bacterium]|jgi:hypothetical protein